MRAIKYITLASLFFAGAAASAADDVKTITLESSIAFAIHGATPVLRAGSDSDLSGTQLLQSYLQFLPNLSVQAGYNNAKGTTYLTTAVPTMVNGTSYGANYSVSTTLNIFNGLSDLAAWNASSERRTAAEKTLARVKQQFSLDVAQSFLQVILDQKLVDIAEKNLKASRDRQTLLEEQAKVGSRNKSDLFRQQAQTSADESFLITTQNKIESDQILLLRKLRLRPDEKYAFREPALEDQVARMKAAAAKIDEESSVDKALANRLDYEATRLNQLAASHDVTSARSLYLPRLDFTASYLTSGRKFAEQLVNGANVAPPTNASLDSQLRDQGSTVYGLTLTWNIFDRWTTGVAVDRAKVTAMKADWDSEDEKRQVIGDVKQSLNEYHRAIQQLETSQRGLVAARKAFEVSEGRYEVGSLSYVDLATTQTALVQAEAARAQALIGYELAKRTVDFAMGTTATE